MAKYHVCIKETLERVVEIEAESEEKACDKVWDMYNNEEIVLDASDYTWTDINVYNIEKRFP